MRWADARGDSFRLSVLAQEHPEADYIVFCGVHFMAESADVLTADHQQVILPDLNAGCSMADMADLDEVEEAWEDLAAVTDIERVVPITYMNSLGGAQGVRRRARRRRVHLDQRPGRARVGPQPRRPRHHAAPAAGRSSSSPTSTSAATPGFQLGYGAGDMAAVEPAPRAGRPRPTSRPRRPRCCSGRATARCTSASRPTTSPRSGPSTPTASSSPTPSARHEVCAAADQVGSTDYIIKAVEAAPARRGDRRRHRDPPRQPAERRDAGQDDRVARPAGVPVLDDVPHRRRRTWPGSSRPWSRARSSTASPSIPTPRRGRRWPSTGCSRSPERPAHGRVSGAAPQVGRRPVRDPLRDHALVERERRRFLQLELGVARQPLLHRLLRVVLVPALTANAGPP